MRSAGIFSHGTITHTWEKLDENNRMETLTQIANRYGTDKGTCGPSLAYGAHNYTDLYEAYLSDRREDPVNILEIGIGVKGTKWNSYIVHGRNAHGGASLKMWSDYFRNGNVYGIDINSSDHLASERIHTFVADQGNREDMRRFIGQHQDLYFDLIIDDGSHRPEHQQMSLGILFPRLRSGGLYFIEDLENNGVGDKDGERNCGRHKSNTVLSTRSVIRSFVENGVFAQPNALHDPIQLANSIRWTHFHAPLPRFIISALFARIVGHRGMFVQYKTKSERLCVIKKK